MQVTRKCGGEIAQLQARLMEKEAQLIGGFGNPLKLANTKWTHTPPFTPQWGPSTDGGLGTLGKHGFGFSERKGSPLAALDKAESVRSDSKPGRCAHVRTFC